MQAVAVGGRFFLDRSLTFGSSSSPGIYDRVAELIMSLSCFICGLPRKAFLRQLDDHISAGTERDLTLWCDQYQSLCKKIGVVLAESDGEKAFTPQREGTILGIEFSLPKWTWSLGLKKKNKLLNLLHDVVESYEVTGEVIQKVVGKVTHYHPLYNGLFERGFFLEALRNIPMKRRGNRPPCKDKNAKCIVDRNLKSQAAWWLRQIRTVELQGDAPIPADRPVTRAHGISLFPDAAGGGTKLHRRGLGCVMDLKPHVYTYTMYPDSIRLGEQNSLGEIMNSKLTFLESMAGLTGLLMAPELICNNTVVIHTDNSGELNTAPPKIRTQ